MKEDLKGIKHCVNNLLYLVDIINKLKSIALIREELREEIFDLFCEHVRKRTTYTENPFILEKKWTLLNGKQKIEDVSFFDIQLIFNILYKEHKEIFKKFRADFRHLLLNNIYLVGLNISNVDFSHSFLQHACMYSDAKNGKYTSFTNCNFDGAYLDAANITLTDISACSFVNAHLRWTNMWGCTFTGVNFAASDMTGSILSESKIKGCTFDYCILDASELKSLNFLSETIFSHVSFCFASVFSEEILNGENITLINCDFAGAENDLKYYKDHGRIKRLLTYEKNIRRGNYFLNHQEVERNTEHYTEYKQMKYSSILKIFRDFCVSNNDGEDKEIEEFLQGSYQL